MQLVARLVGNVTVLELRGPLVGYDAPALASRVDEAIRAGCSKVVVLMGGVTSIEQAGLDALVSARVMLLRQRGDLKLVMPPAYIVQRMGEWFTSCSSETDAILSFWPRPARRHARLVGYWAVSEEMSKYPDPRHLVDPEWRSTDRGQILGYLRSGNAQSGDVGNSQCRFGCGPCGSSESTDGTWAWPEGLAHYVEAHSVVLPDEFVIGMSANHWTVPKRFAEGPPNVGFWVEWSSRRLLTPSQFAACFDVARHIDAMLGGASLDSLAAFSASESDRLQRVMEMARTLEAPSALVGPAQIQGVLLEAGPILAKLTAEHSLRASTVSAFIPRAG
jgi:anti-anti-sigma factor